MVHTRKSMRIKTRKVDSDYFYGKEYEAHLKKALKNSKTLTEYQKMLEKDKIDRQMKKLQMQSAGHKDYESHNCRRYLHRKTKKDGFKGFLYRPNYTKIIDEIKTILRLEEEK